MADVAADFGALVADVVADVVAVVAEAAALFAVASKAELRFIAIKSFAAVV